MDAVIRVYTFKEGLLSKLAHDLALNLALFEIEAKGDAIHAVMQCSSFEVVSALREGKPLANALSNSDKDKILQSMADDVLRTKRFPQARLSGAVTRRGTGAEVTGTLELCGISRSVQTTLRSEGGRLLGELELVPSHFGIKPFRALGGTLRVQDRLRIAIDAEAPGDFSWGDVLRWKARR